MKTIGLIGGMSWESTITYYQMVNQAVKEKLGGFHSAKCIVYSVDFHEIEEYQSSGQWDKSAEALTKVAQALEQAGADFIVLCTNTMHKVADSIQAGIEIPFLHIGDCVVDTLERQHIQRVGLLGTKYTMEQDFYKRRIMDKGIQVIVPREDERGVVNDIIYNELCLGILNRDSKGRCIEIVEQLAAQGAQGVLLGCTEIGLLIHPTDVSTPLFDTTRIHAEFAVGYALG